jgi:hypothetical protein
VLRPGRLGIVRGIEEIVSMLDGLDEHEEPPQHQGHDPDDLDLDGGIGRPWGGLGEVRQNQRERRQGPQHGQRR